MRCWFGRHRWGDHPDLDMTRVRLCSRCGRAEYLTVISNCWIRKRHLDRTP